MFSGISVISVLDILLDMYSESLEDTVFATSGETKIRFTRPSPADIVDDRQFLLSVSGKRGVNVITMSFEVRESLTGQTYCVGEKEYLPDV